MKKILYICYYYKPDLTACSFRNTPLSIELSKQSISKNVNIDLLTTKPNRYKTYFIKSNDLEILNNLKIIRFPVKMFNGSFISQIFAFFQYYFYVINYVKKNKYDLVFVSTSKFFSSYLAYVIAKKNNIPLYVDVRDIFIDTILSIFNSKLFKFSVLPFLNYFENKVFNYASHINLISKGFKSYFIKYNKPKYSFYTNGIDSLFFEKITFYNKSKLKLNKAKRKVILYAGNIGEGQGLHKIIPKAAKSLEKDFDFLIIGEGEKKSKLINIINSENIVNVFFKNPMKRDKLIKEYLKADYLFIHLNNLDAFKKVLPSKIFELSLFDKPLVAGVGGYAKKFIDNKINNSITFNPCDDKMLVYNISKFKYDKRKDRNDFINNYKRNKIDIKMSSSILEYI